MKHASVRFFLSIRIVFATMLFGAALMSGAAGTTGNLLNRTRYNLKWKTSALNGDGFDDCLFQETQGHVLYAIFGEPLPPWKANPLGDNQNAWTNALEFAIAKTGAKGKASEVAALSSITEYLFSEHGVVYESDCASSGFAQNKEGGEVFLSAYINKSVEIEGLGRSDSIYVNCYDQAAALVALSRLLGINANYKFMDRFGYVKQTELVGVGLCNNPIYKTSTSRNPIAGDDQTSPIRLPLDYHAFAMFNDRIFDACIGPKKDCTIASYLASLIDVSTTEEMHVAGHEDDINDGNIQGIY